MAFLDAFEPDHRSCLESAALPITLARGQHLLRKGEPGGDLYIVESGYLEVVDPRVTPEVVLDRVEAGELIGEVAFLDDSPRSADVRAGEDSRVLRWPRDDVRALLDRDPSLAACFFRALALRAARRVRSVVDATAPLRREGGGPGHEQLLRDARDLAERVKEGFLQAETRLRVDPTDEGATARLREVLDALEDECTHLFDGVSDGESAAAAARLLARELHPYLVRSTLAERCIRRQHGGTGTAEVLAHVLLDQPGGDGRVGELLDGWLLSRPSLRGIRELQQSLLEMTTAAISDTWSPASVGPWTADGPSFRSHAPRRVLLVNAGTGSIVAALLHLLAERPTVVTVVDQSRDALAFLDAGIAWRPRPVELRTIQCKLARLALGEGRLEVPAQDVVVAHGLLEYLPDRLAISLLRSLGNLVKPGGSVIVAALSPAGDHALLDRLLSWPTVRRSADATRALAAAAGLTPGGTVEAGAAYAVEVITSGV